MPCATLERISTLFVGMALVLVGTLLSTTREDLFRSPATKSATLEAIITLFTAATVLVLGAHRLRMGEKVDERAATRSAADEIAELRLKLGPISESQERTELILADLREELKKARQETLAVVEILSALEDRLKAMERAQWTPPGTPDNDTDTEPLCAKYHKVFLI